MDEKQEKPRFFEVSAGFATPDKIAVVISMKIGAGEHEKFTQLLLNRHETEQLMDVVGRLLASA